MSRGQGKDFFITNEGGVHVVYRYNSQSKRVGKVITEADSLTQALDILYPETEKTSPDSQVIRGGVRKN